MAREQKKGFVLYYDYRNHLALLSDEERGRLLMALLDYSESGTEPDLEGAALMAYSFIRAQMDRDAAKYAATVQKRREAGRQGGRPPKASESNEKQTEAKKANGYYEKQTEAKKPDTVTDTDTGIYIPPKGGESPAPAEPPADHVPYSVIVDMYHTISKSYPKLRTISDKRKKAIAARWKEYKQDLETFRELFEQAEASQFLKGKNQRNWTADFNWLMNSENMAKVLEGKYADKETTRKGSFDTDDFFEAAVLRSWQDREPPKTAGEDENIKARAEALKQQLAKK